MEDPTNPVPEEDADEREVATGFGRALTHLKPRKAGPAIGRHPWVFDSAIANIEGDCQDGDIVDLVSDKSKFIARGVINRKSRLRIRLYSWNAAEPLDRDFWRRRLERAIQLRLDLGLNDPVGAVRLVYSEADELSGLIVDRYGEHLVLQINSLAMAQRIEILVEALTDLLSPKSITIRSEQGIAKAEGLQIESGLVRGELPEGPTFILEHGLQYGVDLLTGQKTGFYLDQRDNRAEAAKYMQGRRVLDLFCFTGGFSLCASRLGQAGEVLGIDASERAVSLARANAELNALSNVQFQVEDGFQALQRLKEEGQRFGAVVLDPPKFTRTRQSVNDALRAYHRINRLALELIDDGGILVTCSCSGSVTREDFLHMLSGATQKAGRHVQVLQQRGPSSDHPVSPTCLENDYLKCFICRVV